MKPDQHGQEIMQQQKHDSAKHPHDVDDSNYMNLYHSLLEKYNQLQIETREKEAYYQQRIKQLTEKQQQEQEQPRQAQTTKHAPTAEKSMEQPTEKEAYREEDGYLIFDTTSMNGEITHCRVKIPSSQTCHYHHKQDPSTTFASPPATRVGSPQYHSPLPSSQHYYHHHHHITSPKKGLNPNAPEWRKSSYHHWIKDKKRSCIYHSMSNKVLVCKREPSGIWLCCFHCRFNLDAELLQIPPFNSHSLFRTTTSWTVLCILKKKKDWFYFNMLKEQQRINSKYVESERERE